MQLFGRGRAMVSIFGGYLSPRGGSGASGGSIPYNSALGAQQMAAQAGQGALSHYQINQAAYYGVGTGGVDHTGCMQQPQAVANCALTDEEVATLTKLIMDSLESSPEHVEFGRPDGVRIYSGQSGGYLRIGLGDGHRSYRGADYVHLIGLGTTAAETALDVWLPSGQQILDHLHQIRHRHHNHVTVKALASAGFDLHQPDTSATEPEVAKLRQMVENV